MRHSIGHAVLRAALLALVTLAVLAPRANAQQNAAADPARLAAAKALFEAADFNEQAAKSLVQMKAGLLAELRRRQPLEADKLQPVFEQLMSADHPLVKAYLEDTKATVLAFYAERFTVEEIEAIKVFQTSAAGRRLQAEMPNLGSAMAGPLVKFQMQLQPEIMRAIQGAK